jgi:CPA1 family monovalent cation:H+ antiporter
MDTYTIASIILCLATFIAFINHRFIRIPASIAIMLGAITLSLLLIIIDKLTPLHLTSLITHTLAHADFRALLLNGMLSFLLFAGAMHIDLSHLKSERREIAVLALISTLASALLIGYSAFYLLPLLGLSTPLITCLLFGALISPTDPIAVLSIFKSINAPRRLQTIVSGESLFNDGVGIVLFITLLELSQASATISLGHVAGLFLREAVGGMAFGIALGYFTTFLLQQCREINISILVTIAMVAGGYHLATALDISGPLAMVVTGIYVGHRVHHDFNEADKTQLVAFWDIIDELLNAALFLLIGFEMLTIHTSLEGIIAMLGAIPLVLVTRFITVAIPMLFLKRKRSPLPYTLSILTWGGLRGGLAIALALSLPYQAHCSLILALTYSVVIFSIAIQGITIKPLARKAIRALQ